MYVSLRHACISDNYELAERYITSRQTLLHTPSCDMRFVLFVLFQRTQTINTLTLVYAIQIRKDDDIL